MHPFRIGVVQLSMEPVHELIGMAKACEEAGFDSFWIAEAYPWWRKHGMEARSSTAISAVIARETERIALGWGIISPYTRHPIQIGMEARVLQELTSADRFYVGLGASKIFMRETEAQQGQASPSIVMREAHRIVSAVMSGKELDFQGEAFAARLPALSPEADVPRWSPPIYLAGTGPVMQRLAGEVASGLLTASITTPPFVRESRRHMVEGAAKAGRDPDLLDLGSVIVGSIGSNAAEAAEGSREMAAMYLANKVQNIGETADSLLAAAGLSRRELLPIAEAMETGGRRQAAKAVTDDVLMKVKPIAGTPADCIAAIEEYQDAGCTHVLLELWGDRRREQARMFGEAVLPHFRD